MGRKQSKGFRRGGTRSDPYNRNNLQKQNNELAVNREIGQKPTGKQHDICNRCGLSGHWSRTCRMQKHFMDLYQASLEEVNNALVMHNSSDPINTKDLEDSNIFFWDPNGHIGGSGVIGHNN